MITITVSGPHPQQKGAVAVMIQEILTEVMENNQTINVICVSRNSSVRQAMAVLKDTTVDVLIEEA